MAQCAPPKYAPDCCVGLLVKNHFFTKGGKDEVIPDIKNLAHNYVTADSEYCFNLSLQVSTKPVRPVKSGGHGRQYGSQYIHVLPLCMHTCAVALV